MENAELRRQAVIEKYREILGRNNYSRVRRDYCFRPYKDGKYYSDCSSSICYAYREAGEDIGILNTVGLYQSEKLADVEVEIQNGRIMNPQVLLPGDILLFAGNDSSREYAGYVGHAEMVYSVDGGKVLLCGHGSGKPSVKEIQKYCRNKHNSKATTRLGTRGLLAVRRIIRA